MVELNYSKGKKDKARWNLKVSKKINNYKSIEKSIMKRLTCAKITVYFIEHNSLNWEREIRLWENAYLLVGFQMRQSRKVGVQKRFVFSPGQCHSLLA